MALFARLSGGPELMCRDRGRLGQAKTGYRRTDCREALPLSKNDRGKLKK